MNRLFLLLFGALTFVAHAQVPNYVPTEGLVAWWPLDGNALDSGPNALDGVLNGTSTVTNRFNEVESALSLDGADDWIDFGYNDAWHLEDFTLNIWYSTLEWPEFTNYDAIVAAGDAYFMFVGDAGPGGGGNSSFYVSTSPLQGGVWSYENNSDGQWHMMTGVRNASAEYIELYIDGVYIGSAAASGGLLVGEQPLSIGRYWDFNPHWFDGNVDDFGIWNRALTEEEILALYNSEVVTTPCYVPTENLEYWSSFDGEATDQSGNNVASTLFGSSTTDDRNGIASGALAFNGIDESVELYAVGGANFGSELSLCAWVRPDGSSINGSHPRFFHSSEGVGGGYDRWFLTWSPPQAYEKISFGIGNGSTDLIESEDPLEIGIWTHIVSVFENGTIRLYVDGQLTDEGTLSFSTLSHVTAPVHIASAIGNSHFHGALDEVGIWSKALGDDEIMQLYSSGLTTSGCTDSEACNFDASAFCDDGNCIYPPTGALNCEVGEAFCAEGTTWNSATQSCDPLPCEAVSDATACGPGTYWDDLESLCLPIETCTDDLDGDGVIGVNDLMQLLSSFGTDCPETGDTSGDPETAEFTCGDPVNYHGYDYATVEIGEQCWFAENLRSELYRNGDSIPGNLTAEEWVSANDIALGAQAIYNDDTSYIDSFGRLYNGHAVQDDRSLCPTDWHVGSNSDWVVLEQYVGEQGFTNQEGLALKSTFSWNPNGNQSGNGIDAFGFSAVANGSRRWNDGTYNYAGIYGQHWTSSLLNTNLGYRRSFRYDSDVFLTYDGSLNSGASVRCLKDQ